MVPGTGKPLNQCPKNVKEALEWLAALADGATACANVIQQQILGSTVGYTNTFNGNVQNVCQQATAFMNEIRNGSGGASYTSYTSTYQGAQWNDLCQPQGGRCCATTNGYGACSQCHGAHCTGCCKNCPKQICARIFCLIVPVVYSALWYLYSMLQLNNGRYSSGNGNTEAYLRALGFNSGGIQLYNTDNIVQQALQRQRSPSSGTLLGALGAATREINTALQNNTTIFVDGQSSGGLSRSHSSTASQLTTPTSAKDLMLWTIFLPYCCDYQYVHGMLRQSLLSRNGGRDSGAQGAVFPYSSPLDNLMSGLHVLFIGMEYGGQGQSYSQSPHSSQTHQPPRTLFEGIAWISYGMAPYEYYTSGSSGGSSGYGGTTQCCKLLVAGIPIMSWAVEMLQGHSGGGVAQGSGSPYGIGLEQHLGFGNSGMRGLQQSLGAQIIHDVHSMVQPIKTAYANNQFQVLISIGTSHTSHSQVTPTTFREMLLWLQGLPCSGGYHEVRTLLTNGNSGSSGPHVGPNPDPLVGIIFKLPYLFYSLDGMNTSAPENRGTQQNGTMTRYITDLFQRQGIQVKGNGATRSRLPATSPMPTFLYNTDNIQKTFCAIVTIVYYVVDHLKRKYNGERGYHSIGSGSGLLEFLGWQEDKINGWMTGYDVNLNGVLELCFGNGSHAAHSSGGNGDPLSQLFKQLRTKLSSATTSDFSTHSAPSTFRETLLWLVGAPLTQEYESKKTELATAVQSSHSSSTDTLANHITDTIVGVLQLFHRLEGNLIQTVIQGVFQNGGTGTSVSLRYNYGVTDSNNDVVGTLCGTTVVMRSVFGFLQQRCDRTVGLGAGSQGDSSNDSWKECTVTCGNGGQATSSTTQCQDNNPLCKFLCLLGWDHKTRGAQSTTTTPTLNGTAFHDLLLKCFGSLDTTGQGVSSSYTYVTSSAPSLKALYDCAVQWFQKKTGGEANKGTDSSTTPTTTPTIRDMMLWLIGLPLHSVYKALTDSNGTTGVIKNKLELVKSRTSGLNSTYSIDSSKLSNSSQITNAIVSSSQGMIITMLAIEGNIKSVWEFLTKGLKTDNHTFNYGSGSGSGSGSSDSKSGSKDSDPEACFSLLVDYTYKVHYQLRFLLVMCNTPKNNGGWKECEYGNGNCNCTDTLKTSCLKKFLEDGSKGIKSPGQDNKFVGPEKEGNVGMGFSKITHTTTTGSSNKLTGSDIYALLKYYVDTATENNRNMYTASQPFSLLAQCIVAIGQRAPSTLGDCFELVWQLGYGELRSYVDGELKEELKDITLEVTGGENNNGQKDAGTALITAIQNLFSNHSTDSSSSNNHDKSLISLMCSSNGTSGSSNGCTPYMKSLSQGVYHYYLPEVKHEQDKFHLLQYLYDMLRKLLDKMKELKDAFEKCECCKNTESSDCQGLIQCPNAHPILYKFGFVFGKPEKLNGKKCETLKQQLKVVLDCTQDSPSALFSAFECVIQVTYSILLQKAKGIIDKKYDKNGNANTPAEGLKSTNQEMNTAFTLYVTNAMYDSYPRLICTFACKVFKDGDCDGECEKFRERITKPEKEITASKSNDITVTSSAVTSITAVIPQYTAPPIDRYHYRTFNKSITKAEGSPPASKVNTSYDFSDALDFHVKGANCIRPTPVALRSVIDWMLRVTTGAIATGAIATKDGKANSNDNDNISKLTDAIKSVLGAGLTDTEVNVQQNVTDLVTGLRKFVGYTDKSQSVKDGVTTVLGNGANRTNGVKGELNKKIGGIKTYLENKEKFGEELGKALMKGQYAFKETDIVETFFDIAATLADTFLGSDAKKNIHVKKHFKDAVKSFTEILKSPHPEKYCQGLNCNSINNSGAANSSSASGTVQNDGLQILKDLFTELQNFAQKWNSIGQDNGHGILQKQKGLDASKLSQKCNGSSSANDQYFTKLYQALHALGECAEKIKELNNNGNGVTDSKAYRQKVSALIDGLKKFGDHIKDCDFNGSEDSQSNGKADPQYAVNGAQRLIEETKKGVEKEITGRLAWGFKESYNNAYSYGGLTLKITELIGYVSTQIHIQLDFYKSHLDDLKRLCQWLYRMGQLYAHGLKGFVESLISHLEHIHRVIVQLELLMDSTKSMNAITSSTYTEVKDDRDTIPALIAGILNSYILKDADKSLKIDGDNAEKYRGFLTDLRLIALDRYTLQVWQDECNKNAKDCRIKDWITFENGIVRNSDLKAMKQQLSVLTGIVFDSNTASSSAPPSASHRIHDFHAICVIQKFSYEAPITRLERSLKELQKIQRQLEGVKKKCESQTDVSTLKDDQQVTSFCDSVSQFLSDPYGIYSFAKFVHTIMGPNVFSAVIVALEELKEANKYQKNNGGKLDKIKGILEVLVDGNTMDSERQNDYKLESIITKLSAFITTLRREYIFSYPVVTATATLPAAPAPSPPPQNPTCPNRDHSKASICHHCYYYLARIFIGAIPNLYRHCRLLYEMCKYEGLGKDGLWYNDVLQYYNSGIHYHDPCYQALGVYMSWRGWKVYKKKDPEAVPEKYDLSETHKGINMFQSLEAIVSIKDPFKDSDLQPLDQLFKAVMQHFKDVRNKKKTQREKKERQAFEEEQQRTKSGLTFQAPPAPLPSTVRQVLFWLHEMDTNKAFYDAMSQHINTLCQNASIPISHDTILHVLKLSITQCLEVLATIEDPGRQNAQYYYELYTEEHYYAYPTVNIPLFFYTFVEKLMGAFLELNFVCVQCEFRALEGGWSECHIGKGTMELPKIIAEHECLCTKTTVQGSTDSRLPLNSFSYSSATAAICPRPLYSFLFDNKTDLRIPGDISQRLPYMSKGAMPCGFQLKNKAITDAATRSAAQSAPTPAPTSVSGSVLVEPLRKLVGGHVTGRYSDTSTRNDENNTLSTVIYLRDLLRYVLCLAVRPPWSMSENMAFFYRVTESWKKQGGGGVGFTVAQHNAQLLGAIHAEIDMFPGTFDGERLTKAVERFAGVEDSEHQHDKANSTHSNTSHQYDLRTLMGCQELSATSSGTTAQCSTFMFPLSLDVYTHYDHRNSRAYLSWILNFAFGIYGQLKALEEMIKGKNCVMKSTSSNTSQCPSLPMCPGVLTALYQSGSSFMDQKVLADVNKTNAGSTTTTTKKTCNDFHSVLNGLFNCKTATDPNYCTPLHNLIVQCEAFLWSIRMPFSLVQLSLWSVAILFISYVFVVPLDHFKIKSHLFNRLKYTMHPSLLIADQQRRVSEVAYFSL